MISTSGSRVTSVSTYAVFEVTNAPHKNMKDNNIEAAKLDHYDQELQ